VLAPGIKIIFRDHFEIAFAKGLLEPLLEAENGDERAGLSRVETGRPLTAPSVRRLRCPGELATLLGCEL
jgi:hypothetical protein